MEQIKSVTEIFDDAPSTDSTKIFDRLWSVMATQRDRIMEQFDLNEDMSLAEQESFGGDSGPRGSQRAWTGSNMDWLVNSWIGDPEGGFTNMHLTAWLGPDTNVPHLGMAWGTLPHLWFFVDLLPRADLWLDLDYVDQYYEPANEAYLELLEQPGVTPFVSKDTYTRVSVSQSAFCVVLPTTDENIDLIETMAATRIDQWLSYLAEAPKTDPEKREALATRDLAMRTNIAERDPANALAERFFGEELTQKLIRNLTGADRLIERPR